MMVHILFANLAELSAKQQKAIFDISYFDIMHFISAMSKSVYNIYVYIGIVYIY